MKIAIIGAGATGLAAAYELCKHGHQVVIYEKDSFLGGHASTFQIGDARLERGYHHWFTNDTNIIELVNEIGLGHQIRWIEPKVGTLHDGKIYNFVTPIDLLKFTPLKLIDRLRLGLSTFYLQLQKRWRNFEHITAVEWLSKYAGKQAYEIFWRPMLRGKFGDNHYRHVGMTWVWGKIHTRVASRDRGMLKEKLGYPIGSFGEIFEKLQQIIIEQGGEINLSTQIHEIIIENNRATGVRINLPNKKSSVQKFDAIIVTTPSHIFSKLVPYLPQDYAAKLMSLSYLSAVIMILILKRPLSNMYWLNIADRSIPFVGVIEHTNLISTKFYNNKHIVYLSNYLDTNNPLYNMNHNELLQEYIPHINKINPQFKSSWIETSYHYKINDAQPIIETNYSSKILDHKTPFEFLYLANTTQIYPQDRGTNYSVKIGQTVANMLIDDISY